MKRFAPFAFILALLALVRRPSMEKPKRWKNRVPLTPSQQKQLAWNGKLNWPIDKNGDDAA